jgi:hypothetical protein
MKTRSAAPVLAAHARRLGRLPLDQLCELLAGHVPFPQPCPAPFRQRVFSLWRTFWLFLFQTLSPGQPCRETVQAAKAWLHEDKLSANSAAYCQARARLPQALLDKALAGAAAGLSAQVPAAAFWRGRRVRVVDGTAVRLPDTAQNQKQYPQPTGQKSGCGFPVARLLVLFCLACGALVAYELGALGVAERELWRRVWELLERGDVLLGDRGFCSLGEFWWLRRRGVDCVTRLNARRSSGMIPVQRLGRGDWLVVWEKMKQPPKWFGPEQWAAVPPLLLVRQVSFTIAIKGWRSQQVTVATTLLDKKLWPASELAELYRRRWQAELFIRDIKTTLGLEALSCKTPLMVRKELVLHLIAYNLIRALIWEAARRRGVAAWRLSFKGSLDTLRQWTPLLALGGESQRKALWHDFLAALGGLLVPERPGRAEPRALKTRPKIYPLLNKPRHEFVEIPHRSKYRKLDLALS